MSEKEESEQEPVAPETYKAAIHDPSWFPDFFWVFQGQKYPGAVLDKCMEPILKTLTWNKGVSK